VTATPPTIPHTLTLSLEDGQTTIKGKALVALADAPDPIVKALVDMLEQRTLPRFVESETAAVNGDKPLLVLVDEAAFRAYGRDEMEYIDTAHWPEIRADLVHAAAVLLSAITVIDAHTTTAATEGGEA
jgi:hypothetical protein